MNALNWTPAEVESLTMDALERAFDAGNLDPLVVNNGHVVDFENAETPGAATPRDSR